MSGGARAPVLWFSEIGPGYHNPESRYKIAALQSAGHPVLVVYPIGGASLSPRRTADAVRHLRGFIGRTTEAGAIAEETEPPARLLLWPVRHGRFTAVVNRELVARQIRQLLRSHGLGRPILWYRFPSPELVSLIGCMDEQLAVYDLIDFIPNRPLGRRGSRATREAERALIRRADLVLASSERLLDRVRPMARSAVFHPHGVDVGRFGTTHDTPPDLAGLQRPLLGYTGANDWLDLDLLSAVADRFPSASVVIIGPWSATRAVRRLLARPNVHLLGPRSHQSLPAYMSSLDVALLPYRLCIETEHSAPVKVSEYLAAGLSTVGTDVPNLRRFADVMAVVQGHPAFLDAVADAIDGRGPGDPSSRRAAVAGHSWPDMNRELLRLLSEAESRSRAARDAPEANTLRPPIGRSGGLA